MGRKSQARPEHVSGGYSLIPWSVMDSDSFKGASDKAKSLLFALMRQHNGANNGHLQLTKIWLYRQGWTCDESNRKARKELIERGLIIHTKQGGLNLGADQFAVTWLDITNYVGLDISARDFARGLYLLCKLPPTKRRNPPARKNQQPDHRASSDSTTETVRAFTGTTTEPVKRVYRPFTGTTTVHNVFIPLPTSNYLRRINGANMRVGQNNSKKHLAKGVWN